MFPHLWNQRVGKDHLYGVPAPKTIILNFLYWDKILITSKDKILITLNDKVFKSSCTTVSPQIQWDNT